MKNANIALFHKMRVNDESQNRTFYETNNQKNNEYCFGNESNLYYTDIPFETIQIII